MQLAEGTEGKVGKEREAGKEGVEGEEGGESNILSASGWESAQGIPAPEPDGCGEGWARSGGARIAQWLDGQPSGGAPGTDWGERLPRLRMSINFLLSEEKKKEGSRLDNCANSQGAGQSDSEVSSRP
eukprot:3464689-Rhodomonas_salina.1